MLTGIMTRHYLATILLCSLLVACGPAGLVKDAIVKTSQVNVAENTEQRIKARIATEPGLENAIVSVAISNDMRNFYRTKYSVVLAGTVVADKYRTTAVRIVQEIVGNPDVVVINDFMRVPQ